MAHAYTPGLKVLEATVVRKERRLPLPGKVLVKKGDKVKGEDVVARTMIPGDVHTVNVAGILGILAEDIESVMKKKVGDKVEKNEVIAESKGFFGLFRSTAQSPAEGTIESISKVTGQVIIREPAKPVEVNAYIDGEVVEIIGEEGVVIESTASFIQGIFGIGGEARGEITVAVNSNEEVLTSAHIKTEHRGKIVVGGSLIQYDAIQRAVEVGVVGLVAGGIEDTTLKKFLGYDIGVAITGSEEKGITLVITEGFGKLNMVERTFNLLRKLEGQLASINGATQIRAGVIRPEIIVPVKDRKVKPQIRTKLEQGLEIGTIVRIIRSPYFGRIGKVTQLPVQLQKIETEARVRVVEIELEDTKERVIVPRANVEIIEV